ncbi:T9SS type A sorting domain-containing protein, partial [bacterium BMS3Abin03]|nr:T9SS type A sorting domain-containing protein [bacterium BMS3Abin03]
PTSLTNIAIYSLALSDSYIFAGTENGIWRLKYPKGITIVDNIENMPASFVLEQNYPNPFNASTKIKFSIPTNGWVSLKVYNIVGEMVDNLIDKYMAQGTYEVDFSPDGLESGVFFYTLITKEFTSTKKLILLK